MVGTEYLLTLWVMGITVMFFPDKLLEELRPIEILNAWGNDLPAMREKLRAEVDAFIERVLDFDEPSELWSALRELDPKIMALYCDRLTVATYALKSLKVEMVEIPESWPTFVAQQLFQLRPQ